MMTCSEQVIGMPIVGGEDSAVSSASDGSDEKEAMDRALSTLLDSLTCRDGKYCVLGVFILQRVRPVSPDAVR